MKLLGKPLIQSYWYPHKRRKFGYTERDIRGMLVQRKGPCKDPARKWPSANQEEMPQKKPTLLIPSLQNC